MRTIKNMLEDREKVWLYIDNEELWEQFASMAVAEGFRFGNLQRNQWVYKNFVLMLWQDTGNSNNPLDQA